MCRKKRKKTPTSVAVNGHWPMLPVLGCHWSGHRIWPGKRMTQAAQQSLEGSRSHPWVRLLSLEGRTFSTDKFWKKSITLAIFKVRHQLWSLPYKDVFFFRLLCIPAKSLTCIFNLNAISYFPFVKWVIYAMQYCMPFSQLADAFNFWRLFSSSLHHQHVT